MVRPKADPMSSGPAGEAGLRPPSAIDAQPTNTKANVPANSAKYLRPKTVTGPLTVLLILLAISVSPAQPAIASAGIRNIAVVADARNASRDRAGARHLR